MSATPPAALPYAATADGVRLAVHLVPKAKAGRILGLRAAAGGGGALRIAVAAAPENGAANAALLRLLADALRLPRRDLTLLHGATDRRKLVHIAGTPAALMAKLDEVLGPWLKHG